jgi:hypothetical protein
MNRAQKIKLLQRIANGKTGLEQLQKALGVKKLPFDLERMSNDELKQVLVIRQRINAASFPMKIEDLNKDEIEFLEGLKEKSETKWAA